MNEVYMRGIARGATPSRPEITPSRPEIGQGVTALLPKMTAL